MEAVTHLRASEQMKGFGRLTLPIPQRASKVVSIRRKSIQVLAVATAVGAILGLWGCSGGASERSASLYEASPASCDRWVSPTGSDAAAGSQADPYRTVSHMIHQLSPGQMGCLQSGQTFDDPIALGAWIINGSGSQGAPITIRSSDPSDPAQVKAAVWIQGSAHDLVFRNIDFFDSYSGRKGNMVQVEGDRISFLEDELTFTHGICVGLGKINQSLTLQQQEQSADPPVRADDFVFEGNTVHNCGSALANGGLTVQDSGVHGVYLIYANNPRVVDNYIYDNVDRGIQLYPRVHGATIKHNLLDGNGSNLHLSSDHEYGHYSEDNVVTDNLITNSVLRARTDPNWPRGDIFQIYGCCFGGPERQPGVAPTYGNVIEENCIYEAEPSLNLGGWGYAEEANVFKDPEYEDRAAHDFELAEGSPCEGKGPQGGESPPPPVEEEPPGEEGAPPEEGPPAEGTPPAEEEPQRGEGTTPTEGSRPPGGAQRPGGSDGGGSSGARPSVAAVRVRHQASVSRSGLVALTLKCPPGSGSCDGAVVVDLPAGRHGSAAQAHVTARSTFSVGPGGRATVLLRPRAASRSRLAGSRPLRLRAIAAVHEAQGTSSEPIVLRRRGCERGTQRRNAACGSSTFRA